MKATRRHELQENVLGAELVRIADFLKRRGSTIALAILVAAVVVLVVVYARQKGHDTGAKYQQDLDRALSDSSLTPEQRVGMLDALSRQNDDRQIASQAIVALGDACSRQMVVAGPTADAAEWKRLSDAATDYYRRAVQGFPDQRSSVAFARLGLGKLAESRKDFDGARTEYQAICAMTELAEYPVGRQARESLDQLDLLALPIRMASTAPAEPTTQAASPPAVDAKAPKAAGAKAPKTVAVKAPKAAGGKTTAVGPPAASQPAR